MKPDANPKTLQEVIDFLVKQFGEPYHIDIFENKENNSAAVFIFREVSKPLIEGYMYYNDGWYRLFEDVEGYSYVRAIVL